jgi:hypothetical protein
LSKIGNKPWERVYDKTVEIKFAETRWPVYETYQLHGVEGFRYLYSEGSPVRIAESIDPLAPGYASLFLEFARWFDKQKMEKGTEFGYGATLDTPRNGEAALAWARKYGVLGLGTSPHESFAVTGGALPNAADIAAERLGMPGLRVLGTRAYSKARRGGEHETVEGFVLEAYQANVVLKLYEAATSNPVDLPSIVRFMSKTRDFADNLPAHYRRFAKSEWELYSEDADGARSWAIGIVEDAVNRKVENDVYPLLLGEPGAYTEAWGFKSLLGAMWFQMRNYMLGEDNKCAHCGQLFHKSRRDKTYCSEQCCARARAARAYARKKKRQQEARVATRRKLRGQGRDRLSADGMTVP